MVPGSILFVLLFTVANIIWWRGRYSKSGVVQKYRTLVARTLAFHQGEQPAYRATDVTRAMLASHVSTRFSEYAYALFCTAQEFAKAPNCSHRDYAELRRELERLG